MASVKFELDTRKESKSKLYSICLVIIHKRAKDRINLGVKIKKDDFIILDNGMVKIEKVNYLTGITRTTNYLNKRKIEADEILENLKLQGKLDSFSLLEIKRLISQSKSNITLTDFMTEQVDLMRESKRFGTASCKEQALHLLKKYTKREIVTFDEVDYNFLKKLEAWWLGQGNHLNGLGPKMRDIRNAFREASKDKRILFPKNDIPFELYKIKKEKPTKRSINIDALKLFFEYTPNNKKEQLAKDFFVFSFIYAGMNPIDICMLKIENIKSGRLIYNRSKVKDAAFNWEIGPDARDILDKYTEGKSDDDYVFPVILNAELKGDELRVHIKTRKKRINEGLNTIAKNLGITTNLTTYVARHSWATLAKRNKIPVASIKDALGHTNISTTQSYLADLEDDELNAINNQITGLVMGDKIEKAPENQSDAF